DPEGLRPLESETFGLRAVTVGRPLQCRKGRPCHVRRPDPLRSSFRRRPQPNARSGAGAEAWSRVPTLGLTPEAGMTALRARPVRSGRNVLGWGGKENK